MSQLNSKNSRKNILKKIYNLTKRKKFKLFPRQKKNNAKNFLLWTLSKIQNWKQAFVFHFSSAFNLKRFPGQHPSVCISVTNNKIG